MDQIVDRCFGASEFRIRETTCRLNPRIAVERARGAEFGITANLEMVAGIGLVPDNETGEQGTVALNAVDAGGSFEDFLIEC